ncbi:MAG: flagellar export protein FliJ [Asticcacaulis sp.]
MTKWVKSLVRISTYEVETLQKRLAEVSARRTQVEMRISTMDAEFALEVARGNGDLLIAQHMPAYRKGWAMRREQAMSELELIAHEEAGIRDELGTAFEGLKKFEHVAEVTRLQKVAADLKRENAALDEAALRLRRFG